MGPWGANQYPQGSIKTSDRPFPGLSHSRDKIVIQAIQRIGGDAEQLFDYAQGTPLPVREP